MWYIAVTLLVLLFITIIVRWVAFLFVWIFGYEFWILPNLFDESLDFLESFQPLMSFEATGSGQLWWRAAVLVGFASIFYWAYTQPTDFDDFIQSNKEFVNDLYEGNLLSDISQKAREDMDKLNIPTIEDLLSDLEEERVENENFLEEEDPMEQEADVDEMLDSLFEADASEDAAMDEMDDMEDE